jgi:hypothetical protein
VISTTQQGEHQYRRQVATGVYLTTRRSVAGDALRWEQLFETEIDESVGGHRTFAWDTRDGSLGAAREEFLTRSYELEEIVGLVGTPDRVRPHSRGNREVSIVALDPTGGTDLDLWDQVLGARGREVDACERRPQLSRPRRERQHPVPGGGPPSPVARLPARTERAV